MLKRLWLVISLLWAAFVLWGGSTRARGIHDVDVVIAAAPFIAAIALPRVLRFVVGR